MKVLFKKNNDAHKKHLFNLDPNLASVKFSQSR